MTRSVLPPLCALALVLSAGCGEDAPPAPQPVKAVSPLIALTPTEYNNTIVDLLGLPADGDAWPELPAAVRALLPAAPDRKGIFGSKVKKAPAWPWSFNKETGVDGYTGMAAGQVASSYRVEQLNKAALHYAGYVLVSPLFFTCDAASWPTMPAAERKSCALASVRRFAQRAWRRAMSAAEIERLVAFFDKNWAAGEPEAAVMSTVAGVLQAPAFLFRPETGDKAAAVGTAVPLNDWEMASRLSYFLWDTMPDGELFAAAAAGRLSTREQVQAQAERMLKSGRARVAMVRFHNQWLGTDSVFGISPARRAYGPVFGIDPTPPLDTTGDAQWPAVLNSIRHSLKAETDRFIERIVFDGQGTLKALLTDNKGYVSTVTGPLYGVGQCPSGVPYPGGGPGKGGAACTLDKEKVDTAADKAIKVPFSLVAATYFDSSVTLHPAVFPADQRAGVLTLPALLAVGAYPVHPSPIDRGLMILGRLLCDDPGPPIPGAAAAAPPDTPAAKSTNRERTADATKAPVCATCHKRINPAGFAFEHYDSFGRWRKQDNGHDVDATGTLPVRGEAAITFTDGVDLARKLAERPRVHHCYTTHLVRYATGVEVSAGHGALKELQRDFAGHGDIKKLIVAITGSDLFRYRRRGAGQ